MELIVEIISQNNQFSFDAGEVNLPIKDIRMSKLYYIAGQISKIQVNKSIDILFKDKIIEKHKIHNVKEAKEGENFSSNKKYNSWEVEVFYKKEVTDPDTSYILKALKDIDIPAENVRTGNRYVINGDLNLEQVKLFSRRYLANLIVQNMYIKHL